MKQSAKQLLKSAVKKVYHRSSPPVETRAEEPVPPFECSWEWLRPAFAKVNRQVQRPSYTWGVLQGVSVARALGHRRVSVLEFGVAGGCGLVKLEQIAEAAEGLTGVEIDVYGFDTGCGLPKPQDYRDMPFLWRQGDFAMDLPRLRERLRRAHLQIGLVEKTVPDFVATKFAPVCFVSIDLDFYTGTYHALKLLEAEPDRLLPRIPFYFDDIMGGIGGGCSEFTGERLAIKEFNDTHPMRKISTQPGLKFLVPPEEKEQQWVEMMYFAHLFDHPEYSEDVRGHGMNIDVDGHAMRIDAPAGCR